MKTLLILGSDAASSWLGKRIETGDYPDVSIYIDGTNNYKRILKLLYSRRLWIITLLKIIIADKFRKKEKFNFKGYVSDNKGLLNIINLEKPGKIVTFTGFF